MILDKEQQIAIDAVAYNTNLLVTAGPGTGKTRVVVELYKRLPGRVLVIVHTRSARDILRRRGVRTSTVHSVCFWRLGAPIFDSFEGLLVYRGKQEYDWIIVDEAQDLSYEQYNVVKSLGKNFVFVGDPWQSIFGFGPSGSYAEVLDDFRSEFSPVLVELIGNYRSSPEIVAKLNRLVPRGLESRCSGIEMNDTAILLRRRNEAALISEALTKLAIPHSLTMRGTHTRRYGFKLHVMTAHCSKAQEFDRVLIGPWNTKKPEELRLYYVALSRARYSTKEGDLDDLIKEVSDGRVHRDI